MPTYISLIRGINVGGHNKVKMDLLRKSVETLGFRQVQSYIQSGNLVFQGAKQSPTTISKKIEDVILKKFGFPAAVITITADEVRATLDGNPFLKQKGIDPSNLHVIFLSSRPEAADVKKLETIPSRDDRFEWRDQCLYLHLPNGTAQSRLANSPLEKLLSVRTTTRNWNTVNELHKMAQDCK